MTASTSWVSHDELATFLVAGWLSLMVYLAVSFARQALERRRQHPDRHPDARALRELERRRPRCLP